MTPLVRSALGDLISATTSAHPGLLLQRGWQTFVPADAENAGVGGKTEHIRRICDIPVSGMYSRAYERWLDATVDADRFCRVILKIEGRLLIGLAGGGALETGCAVSQTYGVPYIPGSSVKGVVRGCAKRVLKENRGALNEIFGAEASDAEKGGRSGIVTFHDAWWVPQSAPENKPFAEDVVTPHHSSYYGSDGVTRATDLDSPIPNSMIGVRGAFHFTLEGPAEWSKVARALLEQSLSRRGIGAKTRAGYGYLVVDAEASASLQRQAAQARADTLPTEERLAMIVRDSDAAQIVRLFGPDINATRRQYGEDFDRFAQLVRERFAAEIASWVQETKKSNKAKFKAYRFLSTGKDDE